MRPFREKTNNVWIGSAQIGYHDFDTLRETASILWARDKESRLAFHIIGPDLVGVMADMPPNVHYWGAEEYQKLPRWLSAMNIGLYVTRGGTSAYGSPLKVFDYMASGLTVVSTSHPAVADLFGQLEQPDLMVSPGDSESLANILSGLASDRERTRRLGQAGRQLIVKQYNWRRAVRDTMNGIEVVLRERRREKHK
jgi:glycosyltransferase involved in cell wall biosynthesis